MSLTYSLLAVAPKGSSSLSTRLIETLGYSGLIAAGVGLLAMVFVGSWLIRVWYAAKSSMVASDSGLLQELARAHGLSRGERRLLRRVARHYRVEPAARLFVEPERLAAAAQDSVFAKRQYELTRLSDRLFAVAGADGAAIR